MRLRGVPRFECRDGTQLATQGIIVRTKLIGGDEAPVLQLPVIERYAGSLIIAARAWAGEPCTRLLRHSKYSATAKPRYVPIA